MLPHQRGRRHNVFWCRSRWRQHHRDSFLSAWYLMNQSADFNQICMDVKLGKNEELIRFGDLDLSFKVTAGLELPNKSACLHVISWMLYLLFKRSVFDSVLANIANYWPLVSSPGEPLGSWWGYNIGRHLSFMCMYVCMYVCICVCVCVLWVCVNIFKHLLHRLKPNFMWSLLGMGTKVCSNGPGQNCCSLWCQSW